MCCVLMCGLLLRVLFSWPVVFFYWFLVWATVSALPGCPAMVFSAVCLYVQYFMAKYNTIQLKRILLQCVNCVSFIKIIIQH